MIIMMKNMMKMKKERKKVHKNNKKMYIITSPKIKNDSFMISPYKNHNIS